MKHRNRLLAIPILGVLGALLGVGVICAPAAKAADAEKEVSQVVALDALSQDELAESIISSSGAGKPIDPNAQALLAAYLKAQAEYAAVAMDTSIVPSDLDAAWYETDNYPITLTATAYDESKLPAPVGTIDTFRLYNPWTGEHLFTQNEGERAALKAAGWSDEGKAWTSPTKSNAPVYRLFNPYTAEHLYTTSRVEKDTLASSGWTDEGVSFYSDPARVGAIFRLYNPYEKTFTHHFTANVKERDALLRSGWRFEGVAWYGAPETA